MTDDAREKALRDFRYADQDSNEIEAYQITPVSRWKDQEWPQWLVMQKNPSDINAVFHLSDNPDTLWLAMGSGDEPLPFLAWVVRDAAGNLAYMDAEQFDAGYVKVVPVPDKVVHPPADGIPDAAPVVAAPFPVPPEPVVDTEAVDAIKQAVIMLKDHQTEEALEFLTGGLIERAEWCDCNPGKCNELDVWICRQKSPLL